MLVAAALGCFALVPWASSQPTAHRLLASAVFASLAGIVALRARPRPHPFPSPGAVQHLCSRGGAGLYLTHREGLGTPGLEYAAVLRSGEQELLLAQSPDPGDVLRVASRWAKQLGLPLSPAWGLRARDLELNVDRERPPEPAWRSLVAPAQRGGRTAAIALFVCAIVYVVFVAAIALARQGQLSPVSFGLWAFGALALALLGAAARTSRVQIQVGDPACLERRLLGVVIHRVEIKRCQLGQLAAVAPAGDPTRHLLLLAGEESWAVECDLSAAQEI